MARIPLPTRETLPEEQKATWDRFAERGPVLNVQRTFLANPQLRPGIFEAWKASGLAPRPREIVILRSAYKQQSQYEWHQHVRIARNEGMSDAEINAIKNWQDAPYFSEDERALLAYVDEMADKRRPGEEAFQALSKGRTPAEVLGITYLITVYFQLAHVMAALDLELEEPFVGWDLPDK